MAPIQDYTERVEDIRRVLAAQQNMDRAIENRDLNDMLELLKVHFSDLRPDQCTKAMDRVIEGGSTPYMWKLLNEFSSHLNDKQVAAIFPYFKSNCWAFKIEVFRCLTVKMINLRQFRPFFGRLNQWDRKRLDPMQRKRLRIIQEILSVVEPSETECVDRV
jgi:hypothetical protein